MHDLRKIKKEISSRAHRAKQHIFFDPAAQTITVKDSLGNIIRHYTCDDTPTLKPMLSNMTDTMQCVMGPRGSGKSVECCAKVLMATYLNPPCRDGVKRARWMVGRGTYGELKTTTIKTFEYWWGHAELDWRIRYDSPIIANMRYFDGECPTEIEIVFVSFDDVAAAKKALSLELTAAYFNEAAGIPIVVIDTTKGALGRYPPRLELHTDKTYWSGIVIDTNSFADYHPFHGRLVSQQNEGHAFYLQPGGMIEQIDGKFWDNPNAENLRNLPSNYYSNMASGSTKSFIQTQICNQFGSHEENKPVHPEYRKELHCTDNIEINKNYPLMLFHDYGGVNATLVCQLIQGQLRCIKELVNMADGLRKFMALDVTAWLISNAMGIPITVSCGDPADNFSHESALASSEIVTQALGVITHRAQSNIIKVRIDAVDKRLLTFLAGRTPAVLISKTGCPTLHAALCGKYQLTLVKNTETGITIEKPLKNEWSHVPDCLQYACLEVNHIERRDIIREIDVQDVVSKMSWD